MSAKQSAILTHNLGYPRIGSERELKRALEGFWQNRTSEEELRTTGAQLRVQNWQTQRAAGIDLIPSNDFSFYDQILDTACLVGAVPSRFGTNDGDIDLHTYFRMARGRSDDHTVAALEMTKWFDTNYHYLVPELSADTKFRLASTKPFDEFTEALALGIKTVPVLIGPVTFLTLAKPQADADPDFTCLQLLPNLLTVYTEIVQRLTALGAEWVQFDEPIFSLDLGTTQLEALRETYNALRNAAPTLKLIVANYFGSLEGNLATFLNLDVDAFHIDAVRAPEELNSVIENLPGHKILSVGIVNGRNIWRNDLQKSLDLLGRTREKLGNRLWVAPSCSLLYTPYSLAAETNLDPQLKSWLAFAEEKLIEVVKLAEALDSRPDTEFFTANWHALQSRAASPQTRHPAVRERVAAIDRQDSRRQSNSEQRRAAQRARLSLPLFPTTTIGSLPQTAEVRALRAGWRRGEIDDTQYASSLRSAIADAIKIQEEIGLDILVHGEFERNDMVEYFGEQLVGFAFTRQAWVQSYGSRCVKPPIIYGDVSRPRPLTVEWSRYAQTLTSKPVKGMLTGPITILQWSFVRDDLSRAEIAFQIALAIRDEVADLEKAGIAAIQIDEPALREGLPLRQSEHPDYLAWAVSAFRLAASVVRDDTQIHTHMCYAEFNDIIEAIAALDADVISIEASRSNMELLRAFADFQYPNEIGPGIYDIHSPRLPSIEEMVSLLHRASTVITPDKLWINPDCGLKTRCWEEIIPALRNMVQVAREARQEQWWSTI